MQKDWDDDDESMRRFNEIIEKRIKINTLQTMNDMFDTQNTLSSNRNYVFDVLKTEYEGAQNEELRLMIIDRLITFVSPGPFISRQP